MALRNPFSDIPEEEWTDFQKLAMNVIEPRMRRLHGAPDDPQDIFNSAWRTFLERRNSGDPKHWEDVFSNSHDYIKLRLMYHVYRKLRSEYDRLEKHDHKAVKFSVIDQQLGRPFDPATQTASDCEQLVELLLEPCQKLSERQQKIARLCLENYDTTEIAKELNVGIHTVYRDLRIIRATIDDERSE